MAMLQKSKQVHDLQAQDFINSLEQKSHFD